MRRALRPKAQPTTERIAIDAWRQYHCQRGIWYEVCLEPINASNIGRRDVILRTRVDWHLVSEAQAQYGLPAFAASKRQLNKREIKRVLQLVGSKK